MQTQRKIIVLVGAGMGDYPVRQLGERTPLQAARIPHMRRLAAAGDLRLVQSVPVSGLPPGSDVANLALFGYNPEENYTGRAPIEAAGAGIPLGPQDVAFRCNLVTVTDERMEDYSAGQITSEEARPLIQALQQHLGRDGFQFHPGVSYRNLLVWSGGPVALDVVGPHDISNRPIKDYLPKGDRQEEVRLLMARSRDILRDHPVNVARRAAGKRPATQIWLWGQGRSMTLKSFRELYGLDGGVITAVDLVRGIGRLAGLEPVIVPGATGFLNSNFEGKVQAALKVLETGDFVYVHVEAPDECGHDGNSARKVEAIEIFDQRVVGPIWRELERLGAPYRLVVTMDHRTPVKTRGHTREPVPMVKVDGPVGAADAEKAFDEFVNGGQAQGMAYAWMRELLQRGGRGP